MQNYALNKTIRYRNWKIFLKIKYGDVSRENHHSNIAIIYCIVKCRKVRISMHLCKKCQTSDNWHYMIIFFDQFNISGYKYINIAMFDILKPDQYFNTQVTFHQPNCIIWKMWKVCIFFLLPMDSQLSWRGHKFSGNYSNILRTYLAYGMIHINIYFFLKSFCRHIN